nr:MAG TPA: hypothetical protein [Caudoviricetes sp.]
MRKSRNKNLTFLEFSDIILFVKLRKSFIIKYIK